VQEEDVSVLLLPPDGSTGLDLSFATHLFLLEKVKDPALVRLEKNRWYVSNYHDNVKKRMNDEKRQERMM
jgi:hypothetical protein